MYKYTKNTFSVLIYNIKIKLNMHCLTAANDGY